MAPRWLTAADDRVAGGLALEPGGIDHAEVAHAVRRGRRRPAGRRCSRRWCRGCRRSARPRSELLLKLSTLSPAEAADRLRAGGLGAEERPDDDLGALGHRLRGRGRAAAGGAGGRVDHEVDRGVAQVALRQPRRVLEAARDLLAARVAGAVGQQQRHLAPAGSASTATPSSDGAAGGPGGAGGEHRHRRPRERRRAGRERRRIVLTASSLTVTSDGRIFGQAAVGTLTFWAAKCKRRMDRDRTDAPPAAGPAAALPPGLYLVATPIGNARDITPPRARRPGRRRPACRRGHPAHPQAPRDPRAPPRGAAARALPRPQRRGAAAAAARGAGRGPLGGAGLRRRHAAGRRPRLPAGGRGDRRRPRGARRCPGASALLAALAVAGLPSDRFLFAGFLPPRPAARRRALRRARGGAGDAGLLRIAAAAGGEPRRHGGGARRPARRRSAASSPSASRRPGAAPLGELAADYAAGAGAEGRDRRRGRAAGCAAPAGRRRSTRRSRAALTPAFGQGRGRRGRGRRSGLPRRAGLRAGARAGSGR